MRWKKKSLAIPSISDFTSLQRPKESGVSHEDVKQTMEKNTQPNL